eukprot:59160-Prymnesium_polylepis.1
MMLGRAKRRTIPILARYSLRHGSTCRGDAACGGGTGCGSAARGAARDAERCAARGAARCAARGAARGAAARARGPHLVKHALHEVDRLE